MSEGQLTLWVWSWENCPVQRQAKSHLESKLLTIVLLFYGLFYVISMACHSLNGLGKCNHKVCQINTNGYWIDCWSALLPPISRIAFDANYFAKCSTIILALIRSTQFYQSALTSLIPRWKSSRKCPFIHWYSLTMKFSAILLPKLSDHLIWVIWKGTKQSLSFHACLFGCNTTFCHMHRSRLTYSLPLYNIVCTGP